MVLVMGYKHGMHGTPTYNSWVGMRKRCYYKRADNYAFYGARGIKVCERWQCSFQNFLDDMGERPVGKTLDRKDGTKDYSPENCRWATLYEQRANQKVPSTNRSGHVGVQWHKATGKWRAYITINSKILHLGVFDDIQDATKARKLAELRRGLS